MTRQAESLSSDFDALTASDFDGSNVAADGWDRLRQLCNDMHAIGDVVACAPVLFRTMERLDDGELGIPGPLVHTLETWVGGYEPFLIESVLRKPTPLSVWMVNRILNTDPPEASAWLALLQGVAHHPVASDEAKAAASGFLEYSICGTLVVF